MLPYFRPTPVTAQVRPDGTDRPFAARSFELMLDVHDTDKQRLTSAKRILRQIGYDYRAVCVLTGEAEAATPEGTS